MTNFELLDIRDMVEHRLLTHTTADTLRWARDNGMIEGIKKALDVGMFFRQTEKDLRVALGGYTKPLQPIEIREKAENYTID